MSDDACDAIARWIWNVEANHAACTPDAARLRLAGVGIVRLPYEIPDELAGGRPAARPGNWGSSKCRGPGCECGSDPEGCVLDGKLLRGTPADPPRAVARYRKSR